MCLWTDTHTLFFFVYMFHLHFILFIYLFGCATWLEGSQFSDQELNTGHGSESPES